MARSSHQHVGVRRSINIAVALTTMTAASSCLITTDPTFEPPAKTPPFFEPDSASPSAGEIVKITPKLDSKTFSARVQSEDAGVELKARLYMDYGSSLNPTRVYVDQTTAVVPLPGEMDTTGRLVTSDWTRSDFNFEGKNCHRFTLMVVHDDFDDRGCPIEPGDYAVQSWIVQACSDEGCTEELGDCPTVNPASLCPARPGTPENQGGSQ